MRYQLECFYKATGQLYKSFSCFYSEKELLQYIEEHGWITSDDMTFEIHEISDKNLTLEDIKLRSKE